MSASARIRTALVVGAALGAAAATPALAQTMSTNSASYNAGWGRVADQENQAVNPQMRDANGNLLVIDGIISNSSNTGLFTGGGVSSSGSGAFTGGATAIGNSLSVVTQGNNNVVVIDSRQINTGVVTATSSTSGGGNGS